MIIYPAVDIKDGKCVRLRQGSFSDSTVYFDDPFEAAENWKQKGAGYLHVVDLDGARTGKRTNLDAVSRIAGLKGLKIQLGGGIRTMSDIESLLGAGIFRVVLGTAAVKDPALVSDAVKRFGQHIAVGIDARDGLVAVDGWEGSSGVSALEFARAMQDAGAGTVIYTDITRDGMLKGPHITAIRKMMNNTDMDIIASGGVSGIEDIKSLKNAGVPGVIVGKALYTGDLDLEEAFLVCAEGDDAC